MDSFFARNRLSAYLDRSLSKREAESVAEAIARDISLSADLEAMRQSLGLLHDEGMVPSPKGFQARTLAAIQARPVPGSQVAWLQRRLARIPTEIVGLVGAAIIIVIGIQSSGKDTAVKPAAVVSAPAPAPVEVVEKSPEPVPKPAVEATVEATKPPVPVVPTIPAPRTSDVLKARPTSSADYVYDPASPLGYRILHGGDQVLYSIATLADTAAGRLVDVHGKIVKPFALDETQSFTRVFLVTDNSQATSTHTKLLKRSGMEPYPLNGPKPPIKDNEVLFLIEAQM